MAKHIEPKNYTPATIKHRGISERRRLMEAELGLLLKHNDGVLTPDKVVEQAAKPQSALHDFFTWDDDEAAHKWRLVEARQLITSIKIYQEDREVRIRGLVSLNVDRRAGGGYRMLNEVMSRPDLRHHLLETALAELKSIERKYQHLQELEAVWGAVEEVQTDIATDKSPNQ